MQWKSIPGYDGYYEVSDTGEIRSLDRTVTDRNGIQRLIKGKPMKTTRGKGRNGNGYYVVNLHLNGISRVVPVHVLVATAFLENTLGFPTVNHMDGDKTNNCASNLEWTTYKSNNVHALNTGLRKPRGTPILQMTLNGNKVSEFVSVSEASRKTGVGRSLISHCVNNRINSAGGFIWKKLSEGVTTIS